MVNIHSTVSLEGEYQNMEQKCEKQGSNHALTEARTSEAAELQNRVNG